MNRNRELSNCNDGEVSHRNSPDDTIASTRRRQFHNLTRNLPAKSMHKPNPTITVYLLSSTCFHSLQSVNWLGILDRQDLSRIKHARSKRRDEFLLSRLLLRYALTCHLGGTEPGTLEVVEKTSGQPEVPRADQSGLRFNISHSHQYVAVAVSTDIDDSIGVDIEYSQNPRAIKDIARVFCSDQELEEINKINKTGDLEKLLYRLWTRKEAALKSRGLGLGEVPMKEIRFNPEPTELPSMANKTNLVVSSGILDDYCLSVATSRPFELKIQEVYFEVTGQLLASRPLCSSEFTTGFTRL